MVINKPADLKGKKAVVMGLGLYGGGVSSTNFLLKHGASVLVTDLKNERELKDSIKKIEGGVELVFGRHRVKDFKNADLIIRNPGVPIESKYLIIARQNNIPIEMEITLFFKFCKSKNIIGVTGSKGKSTTATLIYKIIKANGKKVVLGGNLGIPILDQIHEISKDTWVVLEISSWQIEGLREFGLSPHIGVVTNVLRDHLNRYKNIKEYADTKRGLLKFQKRSDYAVLNFDNYFTKKFSKNLNSRVLFYSIKDKYAEKFKNRKLKGKHNLSNILAAFSVSRILRLDEKIVVDTINSFGGLPYRAEVVGKVGGITFINDTTATIPEAAVLALKNIAGPITLIAGGNDKSFDHLELGKIINDKKIKVVFLEGSATDSMESVINKELVLGRFRDFKKAIEKAYKNTDKRGTVLLSPGATSFATFINEFDRGDKFNEIVKAL